MTNITAKRVTAAPVPPPDEIHVVLSVDAAEAIRALAGRVGPDKSGTASDIYHTLGKALSPPSQSRQSS